MTGLSQGGGADACCFSLPPPSLSFFLPFSPGRAGKERCYIFHWIQLKIPSQGGNEVGGGNYFFFVSGWLVPSCREKCWERMNPEKENLISVFPSLSLSRPDSHFYYNSTSISQDPPPPSTQQQPSLLLLRRISISIDIRRDIHLYPHYKSSQ